MSRRKSLEELCATGTYRPCRHGPLPAGLRLNWTSAYQRKIVPLLEAGFVCPQCDTRFFPKRKTKYCSARCRVASAKRFRHECEWCRREFRSSEPKAACCSRKCQNSKREADAPERQASCRVCAVEFVYRHLGGTPARYCSQRCLESRRRKHRNLYVRAFQRLRKERIAANGFENIDPTVVFERDGWSCRICGDPVKRGCPHLDPLAPTIDHIIPVSKGGPHTMANVQCAHRVCNTRKNNKVPA